MTLTRKHFETIAAELRAAQPTNQGAKLGYHLAITAVATGLQQINPKFDRRRFIEACTTDDVPLRHRMQLDHNHEDACPCNPGCPRWPSVLRMQLDLEPIASSAQQ
jgi:hypothetical protein